MDTQAAYDLGYSRGRGISSAMDIPFTWEYDKDLMNEWDTKYRVEQINDILHDMLAAHSHLIELNDRQFSPFEHTAHTFNTATDPDCNHDSMLQCPQCSYVTKAYNDHMGEIVSLDCPSCSTISDIDDCTIDYCDNCQWYQDELWNRFEDGINDGIEDGLTERLGLEEDTM